MNPVEIEDEIRALEVATKDFSKTGDSIPPTPSVEQTVRQAYEALTKAMREDRAYAYSWHCNIAMPILDGSNGKLTHEEANQIAEKLMAHLFNIKNSRALFPS